MEDTHSTIFVIGVLGVLSILASAFALRFKAPLLLVFLGLGMLAGSDGPGGIVFNDFYSSYFFGSLALTVILFNGGLKTERAMVSAAIWPSVVLATLGVFVSAAVISVVSSPLFHLSWTRTLLIGAAVAPTDAAAVATLLKIGAVKVPFRVAAILEMESGLNDPISVFLMIFAVDLVLHPATMTFGEAGRMVLREMLGGAAIGVAGGSMLLSLLKILKAEAGIFPVLAFSGALMIFGGAQLLGTSGFLAIYIAAYIVGGHSYRHEKTVQEFFDAFAWVAQIGLFLLLGLLVTPHDLWQIVKPAMVVSVCLISVRAADCDFRLLNAVPGAGARDGVYFLGGLTRRGADLSHAHPRPGRAAAGLSAVQLGFCGGGDIPRHPGLDRGAGGADFRVQQGFCYRSGA